MSAAAPAGSPWPPRRRRWRRLGVVLVLALLPRLFFELHHVDGLSMWPAFNEDGRGEWLLVLRDWVDREPRIWDPIVVVDPDDGDRSVLKRVCGLIGSLPRIEDGDLLLLDSVGGRERFVPRSLEQIQAGLVPLGRLRDLSYRRRGREGEIVDAFRRVFVTPELGRAALSDAGAHLLLEADEAGRASVRIPAEDFRDDHRGLGGRMTPGENLVRDLAITFALADGGGLAPGRRLVLRQVLEDRGPDEELELTGLPGALEVRLGGRGDGEQRATLPVGPELVLRWLLVDDRRALLVGRGDGGEDLEVLLEARRDLVPGSPHSHLKLDCHGGSVVLSRLDIDRDLHYIPASRGSVGGSGDGRELPREQPFLLGDNGPASRDSRQWRAEAALERIGRPVLVIWPWRRARVLD